ncbi:PCI domain-containing protein [Cryptosporidium felis]|nr:PCI domain-containing protein [Cryptosporidium felis]
MEADLRSKFEEAKSKADSDFESSISLLLDIIKRQGLDEIDDGVKIQEQAIYLLGGIYEKQGMASELKQLVGLIGPIIGELPKARVAKIIRTLMDKLSRIPNTEKLQEELCLECIEWCKEEKRTFLRHRITARLATVYLSSSQFVKGLEYLEELIKEVKKVDDKVLLVEIYLIESKLEYRIRNIPKSKAALTAARTNANSIHCPPLLQADIDLQSGIILADEGDYKTSFSYFYEAFEAFNIANDERALQSLKYMLLSKIMSHQTSNLGSLLSGKNKVSEHVRGRPEDLPDGANRRHGCKQAHKRTLRKPDGAEHLENSGVVLPHRDFPAGQVPQPPLRDSLFQDHRDDPEQKHSRQH